METQPTASKEPEKPLKRYQSRCVPVRRETFPYLIRFRSLHKNFILPELDSLSELFDTTIEYDEDQISAVITFDHSSLSPFLRANFESHEKLKKISGRSLGIMHIYETFAEANSFEELVKQLENYPMERFYDGKSFKFIISAFGKKYSRDEQAEIFIHFKDLELWNRCPISLDNPEREFVILIDYGRGKKEEGPRRLYFGLKLTESNSHMIDMFDVKKRVYIGTTSMDSELSLLVANQALARPASLMIDTFAGTGSLMIACALFGAKTLGGDIDKRMLSGLGQDKDVKANFKQFGVADELLDLVVTDNAHPCWRSDEFLDAIVCDPPYGVRAGARKVGMKRRTLEQFLIHQRTPQRGEDHVPQCVAYVVSDVMRDLLTFAAQRLRVGGRLVYWLPTMTQEYKDEDLPLHPCLEIIANSVQPLTFKWERRLITMVKTIKYDPNLHDNLEPEMYGQHVKPAHDSIKGYFHPHMKTRDS